MKSVNLNIVAVSTEAIIFLSYILICAALFKRRLSLRAAAAAFCAGFAVIAGAQAAIILLGEEMLALTLLPLTAYLPFSVLLYFLSEGGLFETAAVCSMGMLNVLILKSLYKILLYAVTNVSIYVLPNVSEAAVGAAELTAAIPAVVAAAAAGIAFVAIRFIVKPFRFCIAESGYNHLLPIIPVISVFLLLFYFLNSTTDVFILILTMCIALSIFLILAKLLLSAAELMESRRSEKRMSEYIDMQRRDYDRVMRKMESGREYRHDMRHHLAMIEGLAKQGSCGEIIEYAGKLNGRLNSLESVNYCKCPEVNAVLSEYITRAEDAGCSVAQSIALPEKLPFEESDVCIVLANSIENAINACLELPDRYINISVECTDGHRLFVSVINPCREPIVFDENGLPSAEPSEEHGIGLRSVKRVAEKYNGFLRCKVENGEFVFRTALFYEESSAEGESKGSQHDGALKRAATSLLGFGIGAILVLNIMPSAAEAASSLLSVNIRTVRSLALGWGDSGLNIESPEFGGDGAEELNAAVKNYTDEAREKFMWYFNRRYNGYAAEDMRYTVIRDDERYFVSQFCATINAGGSMDFNRWIVFDKDGEKVLELSDMFEEGADYTAVLSAEILGQMTYKNENEGAGFFIEGSDAFTEIKEDANFYIDAFDRLVIVFDEYEVAPGFMGCPEFIIPDNIMEEIAR
ncbi:MAG: GHKL domain-containing protein [Bacteroides sp.]|nr:GHKL domain-containing protein [Bacteroides sp.]